MMKIYFLASIILLGACQSVSKPKEDVVLSKKNCQLNSIEDSILRYPEIVSIVDNLKSKKTRIAFQSKEFGEHFEVIVGHNNPERFETFFEFKIIKKNCAYYVYSKELDKYISIQEWRKSRLEDPQ